MKKIYLAGPDVFLPNYADVLATKLSICERYGLEGIAPSDADFKYLEARDTALAISEANENLIRSSDIFVANLTPFRGISADVGTVYELGFAKALGKKTYAYTTYASTLLQRTVRYINAFNVDAKVDVDADGCLIEDFDLFDNLMLYGAVRDTLIYDSRLMKGFETCIKKIATDVCESFDEP